MPVKVLVTPVAEASISTASTIAEDTLTQVTLNVVHQNGDTNETLNQVWINTADVTGKNFTLFYGNSLGSTLDDAANDAGNTNVSIDGGFYKLTGPAINNIYAQYGADISTGYRQYRYQVYLV